MRVLVLFSLGLCLASVTGCAIVAGYDFGKYHEGSVDGGSTGAGGTSASSGAGGTGGAGNNCGTGGSGQDAGAGTYVLPITAPAVPRAIAVDNDFLYWVDGMTQDKADSAIHRVFKKDGTMDTKLVSMQTGINKFAVDKAYVYYATTNGIGTNDLFKISQATPVMPELVFNTMQNVGGLAVHGGYLYWTTQSGVWKMKIPNGFPELPIMRTIVNPGAVVVDDTGIYWLEQGLAGTTQGEVYRADLDGMNLKALAANQKSPSALATSCAGVFWTTIDNGVFSVPLAGGAMFTYQPPLGMGQVPQALGVGVDGARVYFTRGADVVAAPFGKTSTAVLSPNQQNPGAIALDGESVYFTTTMAPGGGGSIVKVSK
jgi:hypothetical protein